MTGSILNIATCKPLRVWTVGTTNLQEICNMRDQERDDLVTPNPLYYGKLRDRYEIYVDCADDGNGFDIGTGEPLKTFDEWLDS